MPVARSLLTALAVLVVTPGSYYLFRYKPAMKSLWAMSDINKYVEWHESLELAERKTAIDEFSGKLGKTDELFEEDHNAAVVMAQMTESAQESEVEFVTIKPMAPREETGHLLTAISLTVRATYFDLIRFIRGLEESGKFINIVAIHVRDDAAEAGKLQVVLTVEVYQRRNAEREKNDAGES